jgi:hypothetical protein
LEINPADGLALFFLGLTYDETGNWPAALEVLQELKRLDHPLADKLFNWIVPR